MDATPINPEPSPKNDVAVITPATETLSKFVCPSTSKSPEIETSPVELIRSLSTPAVSTVNVSAIGNLIAVSASPEWINLSGILILYPLKTDTVPATNSPLNLACPVNVETPAMLTLSKFVWPSTSNSTKSPLPTNVVAVTTPTALMPLSTLMPPVPKFAVCHL